LKSPELDRPDRHRSTAPLPARRAAWRRQFCQAR